MRSGTNLPRVGGYNRAVILEAIRHGGDVSRVELARLTGLTSQTVSNIVRRLITEGLVVETGRLPSAGGKPRTALALNPHGAYAVGIHLDPDATVTVLVDLAGTVVARVRRRSGTGRGSSPRATVRRLSAGVDQVIRQAGVPAEAVLGVGVAAPGPIDPARGMVVEPPNLAGWHEEPLVTTLAGEVRMPVTLDNDTTAMAVGERWAGGSARSQPFAFLYLGTGIGGGIVLADGVHRGATGNAGEFGHVTVVPDGRACYCGNLGCLEAHCTPRAMVTDLVERHGRAARRLDISAAPNRVRAEYARLCRAADAGDPAAADVVERSVRLLAQASVTLVNVLDVELLVLGGSALRQVADVLLPAVSAAVNERTIARWVRTVSVERSALGDDVGAIGAASLVLHGAYAPGWTQLLSSGVA